MAYNTRSIKKDVDGRPIPQYFNQMTDNYEPLLGENGAARSVLYGPDGQPISSSNRLPVDVGGAVDISDRADRRLGQVTLSGRIEEVPVFEGLALADTEWVMSQTIDVSQYTRAQVWINSTLNAPVEISIRRYASVDAASIVMTYKDGQWAASDHTRLQIPGTGAGRSSIVANTFWTWLNESPLPFPTLAFRVRATEVATSGSLSIYIRGVRPYA